MIQTSQILYQKLIKYIKPEKLQMRKTQIAPTHIFP